MKRAIIVIITIVLFGATSLPVKAQEEAYKWDAGLSLGMSGYIGEANSSNLYQNPGFAAALSMRYLIDTRWALRGMFTTMSLRGNSADMENVFPGGKTYEFSSQVYDLGVRAEANFFSYGIGETYKKLRRWTPYLAVGIGATLSSVDGDMFIAMNVPMSLGVKFKLRPRLNLGLEWTITKVFGDNVDGKELSNVYSIENSFIRNSDWHSSLMISISYEFGKRCVACYYED